MMKMMSTYSHDEDRSNDREKEQAVSVLRSELIKHVLDLPDETRAKLLAFLHLVQDRRFVDGDLHVDPAGEIHMTLFSRPNPRARPRPASGNGPEPLQ